MRDVVIPPERICDPVGKRFPAVGRDPERTPMQWSAAPGAGFTTADDSWLPIAEDFSRVNVERQTNDPASLLSLYRQLIWYRKHAPALTRGRYRPIDGPPDTFIFVREHGAQRLLVALNFAAQPRQLAAHDFPTGRLELSTDPTRAAGIVTDLALGPNEGVIVAVDASITGG